MADALDGDWRDTERERAICFFTVSPTPESMALLKAMLDPKNVLGTGCEVEKHPDCCLLCRANNDCNMLPVHANCFPAGTGVSGPRAVASTTRWYSGELVEFQTRAGAIISATPNHPVLTTQGWVAAGLLDEGDQVIRESSSHGLVVGNPDDYQKPALIEDVARSVGESGSVTTTRVPVAAMDFHGDGIGSEVAIVRADGELLNGGNTPLGQHQDQFGLGRARSKQRALVGSSTATLGLQRVDLSTPRILGGSAPRPSPRGRSIRGHQPVGVTTPPVIRQVTDVAGDGIAADAVALREGLDGLAGAIALDEIIQIRRFPFNGHVYNLETRFGWYLTDSIVVHNCRCRRKPVLTAEVLGPD